MGIKDASALIKFIRKNTNQTQEEFCDLLCSPQVISKIENGHTVPKSDLFNAICNRAGFNESLSPVFVNYAHLNTYLALRSLHYRVMKKNNYNIAHELNQLILNGYFTLFEFKCWIFLSYITLLKYSIINKNDKSILKKALNTPAKSKYINTFAFTSILDQEILYYYSANIPIDSFSNQSILSDYERNLLRQLLSITPEPINSNIENKLFNELLKLKQNAMLISPPNSTITPPKDTQIHIYDIIRITRKEQNITQKTLSHGLCKCSDLSRYETGKIKLPLIIQESLLERLGYFDSIFTNWGSRPEANLYNIREHYYRGKNIYANSLKSNIKEFYNKKEYAIIEQFRLLTEANKIDSHPNKEKLLEAIHLTYRDFEPSKIHILKLTKNELEILNLLALSYLLEGDYKTGKLYLNELISFYKYNPFSANYTKAKDFTISIIRNHFIE